MENPILKFAVIGDIGTDNQWCMAGVSRITPMVRKLGASAVLAGDPDGWRIVNVDADQSFDLGNALKKAFAEKARSVGPDGGFRGSVPPVQHAGDARGGLGEVLR